ncbi:hypothetical protein ABIA94_005393 [Bradyrhizobium sp. LA7.1]
MVKDGGVLAPAVCIARRQRDSLHVRQLVVLIRGSCGAAAITIVYRIYGER